MSEIVSLSEGAEIVRLKKELKYWRRSNDLAYEFDWDWKAREIIAGQIRTLRKRIKELTGREI